MNRLLTAAVVLAAAVTVVPQALAGGIAEVRDGSGHLLATAGAGTFATAYDAGWTLRFDSASRSARGVELRGVSVAGGHVYANRIFVPAHGLRGARIQGLEVGGHLVAATPNRLLPLGPAQLPRRPAGGGRPRGGQRRRRAADRLGRLVPRARSRNPAPDRLRPGRPAGGAPSSGAARLARARRLGTRRGHRRTGRLPGADGRAVFGPDAERARSRSPSGTSASRTCGAAPSRSPASTARGSRCTSTPSSA